MGKQLKVGDGFFVFGMRLIGPGYELERRWVTEVHPDGSVKRHLGGAVDSGRCAGEQGVPWGGHVDAEKAFAKGKKAALRGYEKARAKLREDLRRLVEAEKRMRALRFEDVPIRGGDETFEQKKRSWEIDF